MHCSTSKIVNEFCSSKEKLNCPEIEADRLRKLELLLQHHMHFRNRMSRAPTAQFDEKIANALETDLRGQREKCAASAIMKALSRLNVPWFEECHQ